MIEINVTRAPFFSQTGAGDATSGADVTQPLEHRADINQRDWDCLFAAVIERLQITVSQQFAGEHAAHPEDTLAAVTCSVRECVEALGQLQASIISHRNHSTAIDADAERGKLPLSETLARLLARNAGTHERGMRERRLLLHDGQTGSPNVGGLAVG